MCGEAAGEVGGSAEVALPPGPRSAGIPPPVGAPIRAGGGTWPRSRLAAAAVAAALVASLVGWFVVGPLLGPRRILGTFTLVAPDQAPFDWADCRGEGGYSDFGAGMPVTIRNGAGEIVGSGATTSVLLHMKGVTRVREANNPWGLSFGEPTDEEIDRAREDLRLEALGESCTVFFEVEAERSSFYQIEVGRRGSVSYSDDELDRRGYTVALSLGED